jgi:hypothetical protein
MARCSVEVAVRRPVEPASGTILGAEQRAICRHSRAPRGEPIVGWQNLQWWMSNNAAAGWYQCWYSSMTK